MTDDRAVPNDIIPVDPMRNAVAPMANDASETEAVARAILGRPGVFVSASVYERIVDKIRAALTAASSIAPATGHAPRHIDIAHDGFSGDVIGSYITREGKRGFVVQQDGTRVVHVYGEKFAGISPSVAKESGEP